MSILPIDIQTLLGQMNNAGRIQHNIENSPANQQLHQGNVIYQQSIQKDKQVVNLEQTDNQDKKINPDAEKEQEFLSQDRKGTGKEESQLVEKDSQLFKDPDKGNVIDVRK